MISKFSKLTTRRDADQWASEMLEGTDYSQAVVSALSDWIWKNFHGCEYVDVREKIPNDDAFFDLVDSLEQKPYAVPAIAVPHQTEPKIWVDRPVHNPMSDGHDLHAILESRDEAERYVKNKNHQWDLVAAMIDNAWPTDE
jgi:hypothetical protein